MNAIGYIALIGMFLIGMFSIIAQFMDAKSKIACSRKDGIYSAGHCYTKTKEIPL